jgi:hypothetical protein
MCLTPEEVSQLVQDINEIGKENRDEWLKEVEDEVQEV